MTLYTINDIAKTAREPEKAALLWLLKAYSRLYHRYSELRGRQIQTDLGDNDD